MPTLCWDCKRSTDKTCEWSRSLKPVKGWVAQETGVGMLVEECPKFLRDSWGNGQYRTEKEYREAKAKSEKNKMYREKRKNEQGNYYR